MEQKEEEHESQQHHENKKQEEVEEEEVRKVLCSYIGVSFYVFLALLPNNAVYLVERVREAEEEVREMRRRRQEDSRANARAVEIFATHRNAWRKQENRLLRRIDAAADEIARLRARVKELEEKKEGLGGCGSREFREESFIGMGANGTSSSNSSSSSNGVDVIYQHTQAQQYQQLLQLDNRFEFDSEFLASASKFWPRDSSLFLCQDVEHESLESMYNTKHFVARRESPWKVDGDSAGVSSKLKLLEQELLNLEKIGKNDLSKVPSLMRKLAKRYQTLSGKIDDLCRRIASDPCEPSLSSEFQTQRQTEFLLEAFRLKQHASETGQKLMALQTETGKSLHRDELGSQATMITRRSLDSIRSNLKEIQRNLEIWLARIIGDLEGILARDGASRVREYYLSRYPFIQ